MEGEADDFAVVCEIYSHLTEKNKESLIRMAENLLNSQRIDMATSAHEAAVLFASDAKEGGD